MMASLTKLLLWTGAIVGVVVSGAESFVSCDLFLAPSKIDGGGYGVFAARGFQQKEVVEMAPLFLPMNATSPLIMQTVLMDYDYGYAREGIDELLGVIVLGKVMFYNHDREPNLVWTTIGRGEPSKGDPDAVGTAVFLAKRKISKGEELFSSYGLDDGGASWFEARGIDMAENTSASSRIPLDELDNYCRAYCSKVFAGIGSTTYYNRVKDDDHYYTLQTEALPDDDAPNAVAKVPINAGERIEIAPALVLSKERIRGSAISPLGFHWQDLNAQHHSNLQELRQAGKLKVQYQSAETEWVREDRFATFDDVVIFPAAGFIGMIKRVGTGNDANCRMDIKSRGPDAKGADVVLEIVALNSIKAGEGLRLNIPPTGSYLEKLALIEILEITGQPLSDDLQSVRDQYEPEQEL